MNQDQAARWLVYNRYTLTGGKVWKITKDDPEGWWEGNPIAAWIGSDFVELVELLEAHEMPIDVLTCVVCHNADVTELGGKCDPCSADAHVSELGDLAYDLLSDK